MDIRTSVKGRLSPLPSYSDVQEKHRITTRPSRFFTTFYIPLPSQRRAVLPLPIPPAVWIWVTAKLGRKRASFLVWGVLLGLCWFAFVLARAVITQNHQRWMKPIIGSEPTLVYGRQDLRRIWDWEVASGHYPSTRPIPAEIRMAIAPLNPGIPPLHQQRSFGTSRQSRTPSTVGIGSQRTYIDIQAKPPNTAYPPRVPPGTVADLDIIMDNCDFSQDKYVRDCLEVLRLGAGMDNNKHMRRGKTEVWKYIYTEASASTRDAPPKSQPLTIKQQHLLQEGSSDAGLRRRDILEKPLTNLPAPIPVKPLIDLPNPCDPNYPRIFHMFWAGPFTEKPYLALLSYLFTQKVALDTKSPDPAVCRPEFWMWINPGAAAAVPNPNALGDMFSELAANPWASPFLHPRFKDVIKFKMWNTTEMFDSVHELKEWRKSLDSIFNSGGVVYKQDSAGKKQEVMAAEEHAKTVEVREPQSSRQFSNGTYPTDSVKTASASTFPTDTEGGNDLFGRVGSTSASTYDRLSVILSDIARFVLCHRFGGTYLDADTVLLRDWEELWGWKGAFAYRWSRLETYNTAVLRLNKGSALGTFLLRTAFRNKFDFHPMQVSVYTREAYMDTLLLRLPDALFDPVWLAQEGYQRDRPPFPIFQEFDHFMRPPSTESAAPNMLGFDGFFRGAYSYHYHNGYWIPFDPARNFPDLGSRFKDGERKARAKIRHEAALASQMNEASAAKGHATRPAHADMHVRPLTDDELQALEDEEDDVLRDSRDLGWSAVLKRTFEAYIRGERPNMYGEWLEW